MEMLTLILALSAIMWYVIDRFHPLWEDLSYSKYITIAVSALFAFVLSFGFNLDVVFALELVEETSYLGNVITALALMSGSSAIYEIIDSIKSKSEE